MQVRRTGADLGTRRADADNLETSGDGSQGVRPDRITLVGPSAATHARWPLRATVPFALAVFSRSSLAAAPAASGPTLAEPFAVLGLLLMAVLAAAVVWWLDRKRGRRTGARRIGGRAVADDATSSLAAGRSLVEARLLHAMASAGFGAWSVDLMSGNSWHSPEYDRIFGYSDEPGDWTLRRFLDHVLPEDRPGVETVLANARAPEGTDLMSIAFDCRIRRHGDGEIRWIEVRGMREVQGEFGSVIFGLVHDITERKRSEAELVESRNRLVDKERRLAEAQHIARVGSWDVDFATNQVSVSDELCRILGLEPGSFSGDLDDYLARIHPDDRLGTARAIEETRTSGKPFFIENRIIQPGGDVRLIEAHGRIILDAGGKPVGIAGTGHDITERQAAEEQLHHLAHYDYLTALPNRKLFYDTLAREVEVSRVQGWSLGLLFLDLDRFKYVNDTYGHAIGDELLQKVAERILGCTRVRDTVGRLGGDEFGLIVMNTGDGVDFTHIAEKLVQQFRKPFLLAGNDVLVTVSVGIALCPADSADCEALTRSADIAMYYAKAHGRNAYRFYTEGMNDLARKRQQLEHALHAALEHGEFELYYQPEVDVETGQWIGAEALLRWNRPGHGVVLPEHFVPALEECGLIVQVGSWVIEEACKQLRALREAGMGTLSLAVNVSARQLRPAGMRMGDLELDEDESECGGLCEHVERCSRIYGIVPGTLQLELTETALMTNPEKVVVQLARLKNAGVKILVDDFGTGYSSLAYLKRFPIDILKIDREFIGDLSNVRDNRYITRAIITLAHSLKLKVIAEGVETREQLDFLHDEQCDLAQGFYIAHPMPADELRQLFLRHGQGLGEVLEHRQATLFDTSGRSARIH